MLSLFKSLHLDDVGISIYVDKIFQVFVDVGVYYHKHCFNASISEGRSCLTERMRETHTITPNNHRSYIAASLRQSLIVIKHLLLLLFVCRL